MIRITVHRIDGSLLEYSEPDSIIAKLIALKLDGYQGKALIHKLLTDDWGPRPTRVRFHGTLDSGERIDQVVPYS